MTDGVTQCERSIDPAMDGEIVGAIDARLDAVQREHNVCIPLAIESGSRAWGFPSPDSDYDCRFVFIRPEQEYLTPWTPRDVIETPLDAVFDVNGWDIGKAVKLMAGGNAVIMEWLTSKIVYRVDAAFRTDFLALADQIVEREALAYHYISLGREMHKRLAAQGEDVQQKKIFYSLRPAMALRWLRLHEARAVPPMHFPTLMEHCDLHADLAGEINELLVRKAVTRELGTAPVPPLIAAFTLQEFSLAETLFATRGRARSGPPNREAEAFFRDIIRRFGPA